MFSMFTHGTLQFHIQQNTKCNQAERSYISTAIVRLNTLKKIKNKNVRQT